MNTRKGTGALLATLLASTLALGACGDQRTTSDEDARANLSVQDRAQAAAQRQAATYQRLRQVQVMYPTAGLEVPPTNLVKDPPAVDLDRIAEVLRDNNTHTGIPWVGPGWDDNDNRYRTAE